MFSSYQPSNRKALDIADHDITPIQLLVFYGNDLIRTACAMLNASVSTSYTASTYFNRYVEKTIGRRKWADSNAGATMSPPPSLTVSSQTQQRQRKWTRLLLLEAELADITKLSKAVSAKYDELMKAYRSKLVENKKPISEEGEEDTDNTTAAAVDPKLQEGSPEEVAALETYLASVKQTLLDMVRSDLPKAKTRLNRFHELAVNTVIASQADLARPSSSSSGGILMGGVSSIANPILTRHQGCAFSLLLSDAMSLTPTLPPAVKGRPMPLLWSHLVSRGDDSSSSASSASFALEMTGHVWDYLREIPDRNTIQNASSMPIPQRVDLDLLPIAAACVLLAAKTTLWRLTEGNCMTTCIAAVFDRLDQRRKGNRFRDMAIAQPTVEVIKRGMLMFERDLLDVIEFEIAAEVPHKYALNAITALFEASGVLSPPPPSPLAAHAAAMKPASSSSSSTTATVVPTNPQLEKARASYHTFTRDVVRICNDVCYSLLLACEPSPEKGAVIACAAIQLAANRFGNDSWGQHLYAVAPPQQQASSSSAATASSSSHLSFLPPQWYALFDVSEAELTACLAELRRVHGVMDIIALRTIPKAAMNHRYGASMTTTSAPNPNSDDIDTNGGVAVFCSHILAEMGSIEQGVQVTINNTLSAIESFVNTLMEQEMKSRKSSSSAPLPLPLAAITPTATSASNAVPSSSAAAMHEKVSPPPPPHAASFKQTSLQGSTPIPMTLSANVAAILEKADTIGDDFFGGGKASKEKKEKKDKADKKEKSDKKDKSEKKRSSSPTKALVPSTTEGASDACALEAAERQAKKRDRSRSRSGSRTHRRDKHHRRDGEERGDVSKRDKSRERRAEKDKSRRDDSRDRRRSRSRERRDKDRRREKSRDKKDKGREKSRDRKPEERRRL